MLQQVWKDFRLCLKCSSQAVISSLFASVLRVQYFKLVSILTDIEKDIIPFGKGMLPRSLYSWGSWKYTCILSPPATHSFACGHCLEFEALSLNYILNFSKAVWCFNDILSYWVIESLALIRFIIYWGRLSKFSCGTRKSRLPDTISQVYITFLCMIQFPGHLTLWIKLWIAFSTSGSLRQVLRTMVLTLVGKQSFGVR